MSVNLRVTIDHSALDRALSQLHGRDFQRAAVQAVNQTARQGMTSVSRAIAKESGAKVGRVKRSMWFQPARPERLTAEISVSGRPIPLAEFRAKQTRRGVTANAWGRRKLYKGTFLATMPSGHTGVWKRKNETRLPIEELFGPSFPQIFGEGRVRDEFERTVGERLQVNLARQVDRRIRLASGQARRR